jgi:hypothetical protein
MYDHIRLAAVHQKFCLIGASFREYVCTYVYATCIFVMYIFIILRYMHSSLLASYTNEPNLHIYRYIYIYICIHTHTDTRVYIHIYIYIYIYIFTHTHTRSRARITVSLTLMFKSMSEEGPSSMLALDPKVHTVTPSICLV